MATRFTENSAFDQGADAIPDSDTEPDRDFDVSYNDIFTPRSSADMWLFHVVRESKKEDVYLLRDFRSDD
jgi:hypothetical protein